MEKSFKFTLIIFTRKLRASILVGVGLNTFLAIGVLDYTCSAGGGGVSIFRLGVVCKGFAQFLSSMISPAYEYVTI